MGGMLALEWAFYGRDYVRALILIATAAGQGAWQLAWNENQRNTIRCDAKYRDGWYGNDPPLAGLAAARMAALMTYRSHYSFEQRFGRRLQAEPCGGVKTAGLISSTNAITDGTEGEQRTPARGTPEPGEDNQQQQQQQQQQHQNKPPPLFSVQSYLRHHGATFNARFDANCYLHILDKMDTHDITRGRYQQPPLSQEEEEEALGRVLGRVWQPTLVVGIPSDGLYPIREQQALVEGLPNSVFGAIDSREGHDAFLIETAQLDGLVGAFFERLGGLEVEAERVARLEKRRDAVVVWAGSF
jgi:homoserine O-acetyltransferase